MEFLYFGHTDIGTTRETNQDALVIKTMVLGDKKIAMGAVCDGVGGLSHGEKASSETAKRLSEWFDYEIPQIIGQEDEEEILINRWEQLITEINEKIYEFGQNKNISLGTTMTAILVWDKKYLGAHVGDSRAYEIASDVYQLTEDHSFLAREVRCGRMTKEEAKHDKRSNLILQCVGARPNVKPDFFRGNVRDLVTFLLCSDGFWHYISDEEMYEAFNPDHLKNADTIQKNVLDMMELMKQRGERDNISVIVFRVASEIPQVSEDKVITERV